MKRFYFWRSLFFSALAVMAFAACSDKDDDNGGGAEASITVDGKGAVALGVTNVAGEQTAEVSVVSSGAWTLAFEQQQTWCTASVLSGNAGVTSLKFTAVEALPEGVSERSAFAVLSTSGLIYGVPYTKTAKISIRQSADGKATPETNVAAIRALLKAMKPTQTKQPVSEALAAMTITGVVGSDAEGGNMGDAFYIAVQDATPVKDAGLTLSNSQFSTLKPEAGTVISIPMAGAQVGTYGNVIQLTLNNDAAVSTWPGDAPEPVVVTPAELLDYESMVVKIENCYPTDNYNEAWYNSSNKGNVNFMTFNDETFVGYMGSKATIGTTIVPQKSGSLIGIAGQYNGTKQVKPRTAADIQLTGEIPAIEYTKAKINELKAGNYEVEATLVAVYQKGLLLADGTGYTLAFNNDWSKQDSNPYINDVNKTITVKGQVVEYNGLLQFSKFEAEIGGASTLVLPEPVVFDAAALTAYDSDKKYEYVSLTGVLNIEAGTSYNTYTVEVAGYTAKKVTLAYGLDTYYAGLKSGDVVDIKGFAVGFDTSKINIMVREIAQNTTTPALTFTTTPHTFAGSDPEEQKVEFIAKNLPEGALVEFLFEGANADKFAAPQQDNTSVIIKAVGNNTSAAAYTATLVAKLGEVVLDQVAVSQNPADVKNYVLVSAAPADWSGEYIVGYPNGETCSILDVKKADAESTFFTRTELTAPAFDGTKIVYDATYHTITLAKIEGTEFYSMKYGEEYVGWTNTDPTKNNCFFTKVVPTAATPDYQWTLSMGENSAVTFTLTTKEGSKTRNFRYNANKNQERFSIYAGTQKAVMLYQLEK